MRMAAIIYIVLSVLCFMNITITDGFNIATASSYDPPYTPTKCNGYQADQFPAGNLFVSVSEGIWDNGAACGRRYRLTCLSGMNKPCTDETIDVLVVDLCSRTPCPSTFLLPNDAFSAISTSQTLKINVEYILI